MQALTQIKVMLNGEARLVSSETLSQLVDELGLAGKKIAIELNRQIVSKVNFDSTKLNPGDSIELVSFVGGG
jgi:sulfur carrier protein